MSDDMDELELKPPPVSLGRPGRSCISCLAKHTVLDITLSFENTSNLMWMWPVCTSQSATLSSPRVNYAQIAPIVGKFWSLCNKILWCVLLSETF